MNSNSRSPNKTGDRDDPSRINRRSHSKTGEKNISAAYRDTPRTCVYRRNGKPLLIHGRSPPYAGEKAVPHVYREKQTLIQRKLTSDLYR